MSYYSNRFLGSNNNGFVNNGTEPMIITMYVMMSVFLHVVHK